MHGNRVILESFMKQVIGIVSQGTSDNYSVMVLKKFLTQKKQDYPWIRHIFLDTLTPEGVHMDPRIDMVDNAHVAALITELINSLFSDLFKHLLTRKMDPELVKDLVNLGVSL